jgi:hypothetical protein
VNRLFRFMILTIICSSILSIIAALFVCSTWLWKMSIPFGILCAISAVMNIFCTIMAKRHRYFLLASTIWNMSFAIPAFIGYTITFLSLVYYSPLTVDSFCTHYRVKSCEIVKIIGTVLTAIACIPFTLNGILSTMTFALMERRDLKIEMILSENFSKYHKLFETQEIKIIRFRNLHLQQTYIVFSVIAFFLDFILMIAYVGLMESHTKLYTATNNDDLLAISRFFVYSNLGLTILVTIMALSIKWIYTFGYCLSVLFALIVAHCFAVAHFIFMCYVSGHYPFADEPWLVVITKPIPSVMYAIQFFLLITLTTIRKRKPETILNTFFRMY